MSYTRHTALERETSQRKEQSICGSRADFVSHRIRQAIREGRYQPGERIRETEVATWLGVSRTPVREALRRLESNGVVTFESWRGAVVAELDHQQIAELYAMRRILEGAAARMAAKHISDIELDLLWQVHQQAASCLQQPVKLAQLNRQFHQIICKAAHNRYLVSSPDQMENGLTLLTGTNFTVKNRLAEALQEHRQLLKAIEGKKADRAEKLARDHIDRAEKARMTLLLDFV